MSSKLGVGRGDAYAIQCECESLFAIEGLEVDNIIGRFLSVFCCPVGESNLEASASAKSSTLYNLAGQQVSESYKGIVVKNGKKYLNK